MPLRLVPELDVASPDRAEGKQHSAADFFAALPVCLLAEGIVYGRDYWKPRLSEKYA